MIKDERVVQAAFNNALWCEAVCRAHHRPGQFYETVWLNENPTPRYYPNVITLSEATALEDPLNQVRRLVDMGLPGEWAVKDSFSSLDLVPLGFKVLFEATWLWHPAAEASAPTATDIPGVEWQIIEDRDELIHWETAWNGGQPVEEDQRIFRPVLLLDPTIRFIAARQAGQIVAGAIAYHTNTVVGFSNLFVPVGRETLFWDGCVQAALAHFPGLPLVDYEHGADLERAQACGFVPLHKLRVWGYQEEKRNEQG